MQQKTIKNSFHLTGVGIHSGQETKITIWPAPENSGICLVYKGEKIPLDINNVSGDKLATSLGKISLTEHLFAAINGLGLSNLLIECSSPEIPIIDGSSLPFVVALEKAGIVEQEKPVSSINLTQSVTVRDADKWITAEPRDNSTIDDLVIDFSVDFPIIGQQRFTFDGKVESFKREIAPARTFGFEKDLVELHKNGFAKGAGLENALGINEKGYINKPRFENEPVRHKILDLLGDLSLLGRPLNAKIKAHKSGHRLNHELVRRILNG